MYLKSEINHHVNDQTNTFKEFNFILFAENTKIYSFDHSHYDLFLI